MLLSALVCLTLLAAPDRQLAREWATGVAVGKEPAATQSSKALLEMGLTAIPPILDVGSRLRGDERERVRVLLSSFGKEAFETLCDAGADDLGKEDRKWVLAIQAVAAMGEQVLPVALRFLRETPGTRKQAFAYGVLQAQGGGATAVLIPLADDKDPEVRKTAVGLLALARDIRATEALLAAASDPKRFERLSAIEGLTRLKEPRVLPIAREAIHDGDSFVREAAAAALARLQPPEESRVVLAFLARSDPRISVRDTAAGFLRDGREPISVAIGRRYNPVSTSPAVQPFLERRRAAFILGALGLAWALCSMGVSFALRAGPGKGGVVSVSIPSILLFGLGWTWGNWVDAIYWRTEYHFLFGVCFLVIGLSYRAALRAKGESPRVKRIWMSLASLLYVGYFVGWMQLWGWSFEWLELFRLWRHAP